MFQPAAVIAGRYQVIRLVGQGGMSNLYLAYDRKYSNATVVVKEMTASYSDPKEQQMAVDLFHREAKLLASLNHRHIPKVYDYFQFAGKYYLSMEYIDGGDLAVKLEEKKGPLEEKQVLEWGQQIATVLFYLHKHDPPIVFRDVKPSNIMISSQGVKLIDFGIARHFDQAKKGDTMRIGSPGYAPPEQYTAQTDPRSDIYALGVTLHHALTGRDPTATNTPFLVPPARDLNPKLSEATQAMLARATQLDPDDRYQSALDMKKDIKKILSNDAQSTRVVANPPPLPKAQAPAAQTKPAAQQTAQPQAQKTAAAAPAAANAAPANAAQATASDPNASPANSGPAQSQQPNAQAQAPAQNATPAAPKKKRKLTLGRLMAVALVLITLGGAATLATLDPDRRQAILSKGQQYLSGLWDQVRPKNNPEERLRDSLLSGNPEALLPLFQSDDFKNLSEEKQKLFRLNLLAAGSNQGQRLRMVNLLFPEGQENPEIWTVATSLVQSVNATGGLDKELLMIVPQSYPENGLERVLQRLEDNQDGNVKQSYVILGEQANSLRILMAEQIQEVPDFSDAKIPFDELFGLESRSTSSPLTWAIPGTAPDFATNSGDTIPAPVAQELSELSEKAQSSGGLLVLDSDVSPEDLEKLTAPLLLLAATPKHLPLLGENAQASATVLSSPFEASLGRDNYRVEPPKELMTITQSRIYDALALAALGPGHPYQGLTISRNKQDLFQAKSPTNYRWNKNSWLPKPKDDN